MLYIIKTHLDSQFHELKQVSTREIHTVKCLWYTMKPENPPDNPQLMMKSCLILSVKICVLKANFLLLLKNIHLSSYQMFNITHSLLKKFLSLIT